LLAGDATFVAASGCRGLCPRARLWTNLKVRSATIQSLAESTMLLADLWTSAWAAGGGRKIDKSELVAFTESALMKVYRDRKFAESLSLADMAERRRAVADAAE
jgi:hypothetical protein